MKKTITNRGFTLIELLIVVAIIAILAAIAVPNFLEAQVRSKVSRALSDMRALTTAMESYMVDNNSYPVVHSWERPPGVGNTPESRRMPGPFWWSITTPIAYVTTAFKDPFITIRVTDIETGDLQSIFIEVGVGYLGPGGNIGGNNRRNTNLWGMASWGPDQSDNTGSLAAYPYSNSAVPYDTTNGTKSRGDIYRHSGPAPTNFITNANVNLSRSGGNSNPYY